jgi:hypothetical protein
MTGIMSKTLVQAGLGLEYGLYCSVCGVELKPGDWYYRVVTRQAKMLRTHKECLEKEDSGQ